MARPKKNKNDYAEAAAALRDLNRLDGAQPPQKCPEGMRLDPYRRLIPAKKASITQLVALNRTERDRTITLPSITMGSVTDADVGLEDDPVAQLRAETYLRSVIAYHAKEAEVVRQLARASDLAVPANVPVVHVEIPDNSMSLMGPTDHLPQIDAEILAELRRLAGPARRGDDGDELVPADA